jgi:CBS domain-containing protein
VRAETSAGMSMLALTTVADLTVRAHARVPVDAPLAAVVDQMSALGRGCVLVVDERDALVGVFTERDLITRVDHADARWGEVRVGEVMTAHPMVVRSSDSLAEAMRRLLEGRRRHLPIVDDRNAIVGLMSIRDILAYIAGRFPDEMINLPPDPNHE